MIVFHPEGVRRISLSHDTKGNINQDHATRCFRDCPVNFGIFKISEKACGSIPARQGDSSHKLCVWNILRLQRRRMSRCIRGRRTGTTGNLCISTNPSSEAGQIQRWQGRLQQRVNNYPKRTTCFATFFDILVAQESTHKPSQRS